MPENSSLEGLANLSFLEKVTNTTPSIIYIFNQQTQSNEYANRSLGENLGYSPDEIRQMGDALFANLCHPDDLSSIFSHFSVLRQMDDGDSADIEYRMRHKEGNWVWLLSRDTVFERNLAGEVISHLGVATDISEQKSVQETAVAERRAADAASDELRSFAYSISHDMKAPSNTLNMLLNELKDHHGDSLDTDALELVRLSLQTVDRMRVLVDDVLDYTRIIGQEIIFVDVDLNELVSGIFDDFRHEASEKNAELVASDLPTVKGDHTQIRMLFQNLIGNALKYHSVGSQPKVNVNSTVQRSDDSILVHVSDNGIGIAPKHHRSIFDMFKRLHVSNDFPGTGLGLTICKRIALRHGSDLVVQSEINKGTTFTVRFKR